MTMRKTLTILIFLLSAGMGISKATDSGRAALYVPADYDPSRFEAILEEAGYSVDLLDTAGAATVDESATGVVVIPPGARFPAGARRALDRYRREGGNLVVLEPRAFDYSVEAANPVTLLDFDEADDYRLREPMSSDVNPEPVITAYRIEVPGTESTGLHVETKLIGDGNVLVEIPMESHRRENRSVLGFHTRGDFDVTILYLAIRDTRGRDWVSFVEMDREWGYFEVPLANFLPAADDLESGVDRLDPAEADRLSIGMNRWILWPEVGGSFSLGPVTLLEPAAGVAGTTSSVSPWHLQHERAGAAHPFWIDDPFLDSRPLDGAVRVEATPWGERLASFSQAVSGELRSVPPPASERGRERTELIEVLDRDDVQRRPLLEARDADGRPVGTVAEVRHFNGGRYAGSSLALFGLPKDAYREGGEAEPLLRETLRHLAGPRIVRAAALSPRAGDDDALGVRLRVHNPQAESFSGRVRVILDGGRLDGSRLIRVAPGATREVEVSLGDVPEGFPGKGFAWEAVLLDAAGTKVDVLEDRVDLDRMLAQVARYCLELQEEHRDGRYSHHFFSDIYGARFLLAYARHLRENGASESARAELGELTWRDLTDSAFRFGDMIVERQREDGAFPMGYGEHRDIIFVADLGSICLGLVQMATWINDPRREQYIDVARRYFEFRQSFYVDEEKAAELEAAFGEDPDRIRPGFYGIGLLGSDYFDGGRWDGIRREERGRWWVLPVSLSFLGALVQVDDSPEFREVAERDTRYFVQGDFPIRDVSYFHVETLFWMYYALEDPDLRASIREKLKEFLPTVLTGKEYDELDYQGRGILRWLSLQYYQRYFEDSARTRGGLVKGLWTTGSGTSSYSLNAVADKYPRTVYGPSIGAFRYHAYAGIWLMELLEEGSSLLRDRPFPE